MSKEEKSTGEKTGYRLSRKALAQRRRNSSARKGTGKDWVTVKVERELQKSAVAKSGSVNEYLSSKLRRNTNA